jgi:hypothetical protein
MEYPPPERVDRSDKNARTLPQFGSLSDAIRVYVSLRKSGESMTDYRKLILMVPVNIKVSMLKRQIEKEFADLFPKEATYICGKLEDQYGYALSHSSYVYELLHQNDRITAFPEDVMRMRDTDGHDYGQVSPGGRRGDPPIDNVIPLSGDADELLYMLKNVQQSVTQKLADSNYRKYPHLEEVLFTVIPMGFGQSKVVVHNVGVVLNKIFANEKLQMLEDREGSLLLNLLITLLNYWIAELVMNDNYLLTTTVELLEILVKSSVFCQNFRGGFVITNLMNASNADFISTQTKSRLVKVISYLSRGDYKNYFNPNVVNDTVINKSIKNDHGNGYIPSFHQQNGLDNPRFIKGRTTPVRGTKPVSSYPDISSIKIMDTATASSSKPIRFDNMPSSTGAYQFMQDDNPYKAQRHFNGADPQKKSPTIILATADQFKQSIDKTQSSATAYNLPPISNNQAPVSLPTQPYPSAKPTTPYKPVATYNPDPIQQQQQGNMIYKDYVALLPLGNGRDMHSFAVKNLDVLIDSCAWNIMQNQDEYLKCMNLIEIDLPNDLHPAQIKILNSLNNALTEERAGDGLQKNVVPRILKALSFQPQSFQQPFHELLQNTIVKGKYRIDIPTIISIILSPYTKLHDFAIKVLATLSDPNMIDKNGYELQFENHIKFINELTLSRKKSYEFKNQALTTVANLALRENLKPQIQYNRGIEILTYHLRNEENLEGQRLAAKGLLNMSINNYDTRLKIITEIAEEIKKMHRNELDSIVQGYVQTIVNSTK